MIAMPFIYHIATKADWDNAIEKGYYESPALKEEGFVTRFVVDLIYLLIISTVVIYSTFI